MNDPETMRAMLETPGSLAVIGLSDDPGRPSYYVSAYMQGKGFRIIPVNPAAESVLGERSYPSLRAVVKAGVRPDVVNVFRLPGAIPAIVQEMLQLDLGRLWVQQGIVHRGAAETAEAGGIAVVMDRCIMVEHGRLTCR